MNDEDKLKEAQDALAKVIQDYRETEKGRASYTASGSSSNPYSFVPNTNSSSGAGITGGQWVQPHAQWTTTVTYDQQRIANLEMMNNELQQEIKKLHEQIAQLVEQFDLLMEALEYIQMMKS